MPIPTVRPAVRILRTIAAAVVLGSLLAPITAAAQAQNQAPISSAEAATRLKAANDRLAKTEEAYKALEAERDEIHAEHANLSTQQQKLALDLEQAKRNLRQLAVTSYMAGGPVGGAERLLDSEGFNHSIWRSALIESQTERTVESAARYDELLAQADDEVRALVERLDENRAKLEHAYLDYFYASIEVKAAEQALQQARARERLAAAKAATSGPGAPAVDSSAGADAWARLRQCESGGNYRAVSRSGKYRGAYQFDQRTWESVGGVGDPAAAPPEEQDMRARMLYARSGKRPWPHCGRYLP